MTAGWGGHYATPEAIRRSAEKIMENYSLDPRNIGNLSDRPLAAIVSPPYCEAQQGGGIAINGYRGIHMHEQGKNQPDKVGERCGYMKEVHGSDPANIGNLPDKQLIGITSPPFEDSTIKKEFKTEEELENFAKQQYVFKHGRSLEATKRFIENNWVGYSESKDNIGNQQGESYLSAMFKVYQQAYLCGISPLVVVTKNPTRNGALRRLDLDTISLLQACGYEIFDYHRSILFETHTQNTLDGPSKDVHKGRISFFKRLSLEKGTTVAQWEDIIFARIPIKCARPISELRAPDSGGNL